MGGGLLFLSTSDTDLLAVSRAAASLPADFGPVLALNPTRVSETQLGELEASVGKRWAVALRLLGGRRAWTAGFDRLRAAATREAVPFLAWPGERGQDAELEVASTVRPELLVRGAMYLDQGGVENLRHLLGALSNDLRSTTYDSAAPRPQPEHGIYLPGSDRLLGPEEWLARRHQDRPAIGIAFYRAHWMSGNLEFVDAISKAVERAGGDPLPFFAYSLRAGETAEIPKAVLECLIHNDHVMVEALIMTLSFAVARVAADGARVDDRWSSHWLERIDVPVIQALVSTGTKDQWARSDAGMAPLDVAMQVALPEFDGRIIGPPVCFKEEVDGAPRYVPDADRCDAVASLAVRHARLARVPNREKRIAVVLSSYPTRNARVGNAVGLDTPASAHALLRRLRDDGYEVGDLPPDGDELIHRLIEAGVYDREYLTTEQMRQAPARQAVERHAIHWSVLPASVRERVEESWGPPPGQLYVSEGQIHYAGLRFGNVLLTVQPPRGFGENPIAIYHDPDLPPTHHYVSFYRWLEEDFGAHAVVHLGKHGTLEWLPGKAVGLSRNCFPDALQGAVPLFYPFVVNDPGEGVQAKRRGHAVIVDHLIPPMTRADSYGPIARLEQLMDEYYQVQTLDPDKLPLIQDRIWQLVREANLDRDLGASQRPEDFDDFVMHMDGYLCELKDAQIRGGLHVLGRPPQGQQLVDLVLELTRRGNEGMPGLRSTLESRLAAGGLAAGDAADRAHTEATAVVTAILEGTEVPVEVGDAGPTVDYIRDSLLPRIARTTDELDSVAAGLMGGFVPAGPSGAPTRGMAHVLPTGRNFYSVDPKTLPSELAWEVGGDLARALLARYEADEGRLPETVGIVIWGTAAMRTHGDDVAEVLHLLGVRPAWDGENRRVCGLEVIPLGELGRPRVDVVLRISGFFRDAFPNLVHLVDEAVEMVAVLDEPDEQNYVAKHYREELARKVAGGLSSEAAAHSSLYRIFGSPPGSYGAGILPLIDAGNWQDVADLARAYEAWGAFAYGRQEYGVDALAEFRTRFAAIAVAVKNQDNREHDILDSDDYLQYHGGMIASVRALAGQAPRQYHGDSSDPSRVRVRDLQEEVRRVFRTRAVNPKWIEGMMRHGYKGAFEMAATADYLFGYDATADVGEDWMYEGLAHAYALDPVVQAFMRQKNPWALLGILRRLFEAADRRMWEEPPDELMAELRRLYWELDAHLEEWRERRQQDRLEDAREAVP